MRGLLQQRAAVTICVHNCFFNRFVVMKADQERKAAIIRAEGESESARLISEATRAVRGDCNGHTPE